MNLVDCSTNPAAAQTVAEREGEETLALRGHARCMLPYVRDVEQIVRCPSSLEETDRFIVTSASQT